MPNELEPKITRQNLTPGQQDILERAIDQLVETICVAAPQLQRHLFTGGAMEIKTLSGMGLKFMFEPRRGGLILPGGIQPAGNRGIKP